MKNDKASDSDKSLPKAAAKIFPRAVRFVKNRRAMSIPVAGLAIIAVAVALTPAFSGYRIDILVAGTVAVLAYMTIYLALSQKRYADRLAHRLNLQEARASNQSRKIESLKNRLDKMKVRIEDLSAQLEQANAEQIDVNKGVFQKLGISQRTGQALLERVTASERQLTRVIYPDRPSCIVYFGHHKCGSRFFRNEVLPRAAEIMDARIRSYYVKNPPFHYNEMDDLDLCNMDLEGAGKDGRDVIVFANATSRSLNRVNETISDWKGIRIIRDPRQVLISNYFHHKGDHDTEFKGWVWDKLIQDKPVLRELPEEEGILYELDNISRQVLEKQLFANFDDPRILTIKLEDFAQQRERYLSVISQFLGLAEIAGISHVKTGENRSSGDWQMHFTPKIKQTFKQRYAEQLIRLGYAEDENW